MKYKWAWILGISLAFNAQADSFDAYMAQNAKNKSLNKRTNHQEAFTPGGYFKSADLPQEAEVKNESKDSNQNIKMAGPDMKMPEAGGSDSLGIGSGSESGSTFNSNSGSSSSSSSGPTAGPVVVTSPKGSNHSDSSSGVSASEAASDYTTASAGAGGADEAGFVVQTRKPTGQSASSLPYSNYSSTGVYNVGDHSVNQKLDPNQVTGQLLGQYYEERARRRRAAEEARRKAEAERLAKIEAAREAARKAYMADRSNFGR